MLLKGLRVNFAPVSGDPPLLLLPPPPSYVFSVWVRASADKTIVWSRGGPTPPADAALSISPNGSLTLLDPSGNNLFPPEASGDPNTTSLSLTDEGNLAFGKWNSFEHPTDTILTNQRIPSDGTTLVSGKYRFINATTLTFNGTGSYWENSPLRNLTSDGNLTADGSNLLVADVNQFALRRLTLDSDGNLRVYSLNNSTGRWGVVWQAVKVLELCTIQGTCGVNAICEPNGTGTACVCPPGYRKDAGDSGCKLKTSYLPTSRFLRLDYVSFSGGDGEIGPTSVNFAECQASCIANSSCVAFSYQFNGQRTCYNQFDRLTSGYWSPVRETSTYIRVASSESDANNFTGMTSMIDTTCPIKISLPTPRKESKTTARNLAIIVTLFTLELLAGILSFWAFLRKYSKYRDMARTFGLEFLPAGGPKRFSYAELKAATGDFSNVVGRGGFGVVYKGELSDGRIVAVKKLKNGAGGGEAQFWGEVTIIARMHHLNLVRMWGFCAEKEQRMLVYEFIPNGSLDKFLFQQEITGNKVQQSQTPTLDWNIRYRIALGVARAIAYLHEECLEWVLHCDIKPENILLEDDFCPKVSDFGLSKLTNKNDIVTMSRIRGTRGYLAPEWVIHREPITAKADVYSFGVVLLEIVTGTRSSRFQRASRESEDWYFPRWAFEKVYVERRVEDLLDPVILASYDDKDHLPMVDRVVKTAMWCLQDRAEIRPSMGKVAKMLEGSVEITEPEKPSMFYLGEERSE
ncbi:LOW QUALITY PROTEIN: G-type lectin S-receptor-like serine/threonine-protein kinase At1g34300 [Asparagus officinalis]|uniref:LOW QUALITY PROTEIN: G-type lectin S-receptor-like serine/threonine-protein kinase At1g34300 n=1 Tax=Asparagus officinalis TaxID=4686 RepID=UPI00098E1E50|nr:LOW QUALITY PROTEIN: G-type lectin S-receptor-like serine/threonine-protein kinase At1g34300 [Asparagus officinalis]